MLIIKTKMSYTEVLLRKPQGCIIVPLNPIIRNNYDFYLTNMHVEALQEKNINCEETSLEDYSLRC